MTIYEELGLPRDASEQEINQSLRAMNKRLHPDFHPQSTARHMAEAQMMRLSVMAKTLLNPKRRADYDAGIHPNPAPVPQGMHPVWLWLSSFVVTLCLGCCFWQVMLAPGLLAESIFSPQINAEEGPVILSSPNHIEPAQNLPKSGPGQ